MVVVFTGGTGGTKLVQGLQQVIAPEDLTIIVNTGDDIRVVGAACFPGRGLRPVRSLWLAQYRPRMGRGQ